MTGPESLDALEERPELPVGCLTQWLAEEPSTKVAPKPFGIRTTQHRLELTKEHAVPDPESWSKAQRWEELEHPADLLAYTHVSALSAFQVWPDFW